MNILMNLSSHGASTLLHLHKLPDRFRHFCDFFRFQSTVYKKVLIRFRNEHNTTQRNIVGILKQPFFDVTSHVIKQRKKRKMTNPVQGNFCQDKGSTVFHPGNFPWNQYINSKSTPNSQTWLGFGTSLWVEIRGTFSLLLLMVQLFLLHPLSLWFSFGSLLINCEQPHFGLF